MEQHIATMPHSDRELIQFYLGSWSRIFEPDLVLAPLGTPYLYRWYLSPSRLPNGEHPPVNIMFHIQVQSDPERPLHDHPWDNVSHILLGSYVEEVWSPGLPDMSPAKLLRAPGEVISRRAELAHRLILPEHIPYTVSLFTTGPKRRDWGFWYPDGWVHNEKVIRNYGNISVHEERKQ